MGTDARSFFRRVPLARVALSIDAFNARKVLFDARKLAVREPGHEQAPHNTHGDHSDGHADFTR